MLKIFRNEMLTSSVVLDYKLVVYDFSELMLGKVPKRQKKRKTLLNGKSPIPIFKTSKMTYSCEFYLLFVGAPS